MLSQLSIPLPNNNFKHAAFIVSKVHIFWESHTILRSLHLTFDYSTHSEKQCGYFAKFCGLLRIYELYVLLGPKLCNLCSRISSFMMHWFFHAQTCRNCGQNFHIKMNNTNKVQTFQSLKASTNHWIKISLNFK